MCLKECFLKSAGGYMAWGKMRNNFSGIDLACPRCPGPRHRNLYRWPGHPAHYQLRVHEIRKVRKIFLSLQLLSVLATSPGTSGSLLPAGRRLPRLKPLLPGLGRFRTDRFRLPRRRGSRVNTEGSGGAMPVAYRTPAQDEPGGAAGAPGASLQRLAGPRRSRPSRSLTTKSPSTGTIKGSSISPMRLWKSHLPPGR